MNKEIRILKDKVECDFLPYVRKPGRYIGGEVNQVKKDLNACEVRMALCFPDIYEIGMSHTGLAVVYNAVNQVDYAAAERVFAPWIDAEEIMRKAGVPLYSLESMAAVADFDIVAFSMNNELCYTNVLNMLDLAGIGLRSVDRNEDDPLIIAGGISANCSEPMAEFFDMFTLGDGEEAAAEIVRLVKECKHLSREELLIESARRFDFVYVPSLYDVEYDGEKIVSFTPKIEGISTKIKDAEVKDFDEAPVPAAPIVPFVQAVHERISIEIMRGCPGRCRFCQASFCKRPIRVRSVDTIMNIAKQSYHATGFDTVSLLSLSTADYPHLEELVVKLQDYFNDKHVGISLPSLRVKEQLSLLPKMAASVRKSGLTIAVEAASEKLRKVINKPIFDEDLLAGVEAAYKAGYQRVKLYFMVGFPGETEEDIKNIVELSYRIGKLRKKTGKPVANVTVAVSWLVPKAHTPMGWYGQKERSYFENARYLLLDEKRRLKAKFLSIKFHEIERSVLESAIGRGDRRLGDVIEKVWAKGGRFDLWNECFDYLMWYNTFAECGMDLDEAAQRSFDEDDILPWQHLGGPEKDYLLGHYRKVLEESES